MQHHRKTHQGFTLVETLIYTAIVGMVVTSLALFGISISNARTKAYVMQEVQANTRATLEIVEQTVRRADSIDLENSILGAHPGTLTLRMADPAEDPTIISVDPVTESLTLTRGVQAPVLLMSSTVIVPSLVFTNLAPQGTKASVRMELTSAFRGGGTSTEFLSILDSRTALSTRK